MRKVKILIIVLCISITLLMTGCEKEIVKTYTPYYVYSDMIERVEKVGMLTGVNAYENTLEKWNIGGTDLGIPYYDDVREQMYFLFGDTTSTINDPTLKNWRSQTIGVTTDFDASDGIKFDNFVSTDKKTGYATQIIEAMHDSSEALGEVTIIPTGGIAINGTHYIYYMSVREWKTIGWDVNYCGVAKSTDGVHFEVLNDLCWIEDNELGQDNAAILLEQDIDFIKSHIANNFLQIFPYRVDDYVYLFGIPNARMGGVKLARVSVTEIEDFDTYEYYTGKDENNNPKWVKGKEGIATLKDNDSSYILEPQVGELNVCYNPYLGKYIMSFYSLDRIVMTCSDNLIDWSELEIIVSSKDVIIPYGGFTHEKYMQQNGKVTYFMVSQYFDKRLGDNGYNVQIIKVTFK